MDFYVQNENEDLAKTIVRSLEKETGKKIFTMFFTPDQPEENKLNAYIVFKDRAVLQIEIETEKIEGKIMAARMRGNYIWN